MMTINQHHRKKPDYLIDATASRLFTPCTAHFFTLRPQKKCHCSKIVHFSQLIELFFQEPVSTLPAEEVLQERDEKGR